MPTLSESQAFTQLMGELNLLISRIADDHEQDPLAILGAEPAIKAEVDRFLHVVARGTNQHTIPEAVITMFLLGAQMAKRAVI